jgi:hypothetical protein
VPIKISIVVARFRLREIWVILALLQTLEMEGWGSETVASRKAPFPLAVRHGEARELVTLHSKTKDATVSSVPAVRVREKSGGTRLPSHFEFSRATAPLDIQSLAHQAGLVSRTHSCGSRVAPLAARLDLWLGWCESEVSCNSSTEISKTPTRPLHAMKGSSQPGFKALRTCFAVHKHACDQAPVLFCPPIQNLPLGALP